MNIKLERPLIVFDTETTGTEISSDRIISIAAIKIAVDYKETNLEFFFNPGIDIKPEATAVHGYTNSMLEGYSSFGDYYESLQEFFSDSDIAGFNVKFDVAMLAEEFARCGYFGFPGDAKLIDAMSIYHKKEQRTLSAGYKFYTGKDLDGAHDAMNDTKATLEILQSQVSLYHEIGETVEALSEFSDVRMYDPAGYFSVNKDGGICYNFGKNKDKPALSDKGYLLWMLKSDFPETTKKAIRKLLN